MKVKYFSRAETVGNRTEAEEELSFSLEEDLRNGELNSIELILIQELINCLEKPLTLSIVREEYLLKDTNQFHR